MGKSNLDWEALKASPDSQWGGTVDNIIKEMSKQHHVSTGSAFKPSSPAKLPDQGEDTSRGGNSLLGGSNLSNRTGGIKSALLGGGDDPNNPIENEDGTITMGVGKTAKTFKDRNEYNQHLNHNKLIKTNPFFEEMEDGTIIYAKTKKELLSKKNNHFKNIKTEIKNTNLKNKEILNENKINDYTTNGWTLNGEQVTVSKERAKKLVEWENMEDEDLLNERIELMEYFDAPSGDPDDEDYHRGSKKYANTTDAHREILRVKLNDIDQILENKGQTIKLNENKPMGIVITNANTNEENKKKFDNASDDDIITINGETRTKAEWVALKQELIEKANNINKNDKEIENNLIEPPPRPRIPIEAEDEDFDMPIMIMNTFTGEEEEFNQENHDKGAYDPDLEEFEEYFPPVFGEGNAIKRRSPNTPWVFGTLPDGEQSWIYIGDDWEGEGKNNIMNAVNWNDYYEDRDVEGGGKEYGVPKSEYPSAEDRYRDSQPSWADKDEKEIVDEDENDEEEIVDEEVLIDNEAGGGTLHDPINESDNSEGEEVNTDVLPGIPQTFPKTEENTKTNFVETDEDNDEGKPEKKTKKKNKTNVNSYPGQQDEWEENL